MQVRYFFKKEEGQAGAAPQLDILFVLLKARINNKATGQTEADFLFYVLLIREEDATITTREIKLKIHDESDFYSPLDPDQNMISDDILAYLTRVF